MRPFKLKNNQLFGNEIARSNERARVQIVRDFPQTKLNSEINARFLLNEHGDPHFIFYKFNENNILNNWEKHWAVCWYRDIGVSKFRVVIMTHQT